jgi:uncharacterized protein
MNRRLIVDTNLWISYLIGGSISKLNLVFEHPDITVLFSQKLLEEIADVITRPKFLPLFAEGDAEHLLKLFYQLGETVIVTSSVNVCRDPKDNFLLALAADGQADLIVTGDNDLLEMRFFGKTAIVSYSEFIGSISD